MPPAPAGEQRPSRLIAGRYRIDVLLGRGAHGEVWAGEDILVGAPVAIKLLLEGITDPARARREISTLRLLRVPGAVRLLDEGIEDNRPFVVMERVDGAPFPGPGAAPPCPWKHIAPATFSVLETLSHIHAAGVVHRDLKPENVLVGAGDRATILDFGLSVRVPLHEDPDAGEDIGTPLYLSPEQIRGERALAPTDLYALGVMLYEVLAGRPPHQASNLGELFAARLGARPPSLREITPDVPTHVAVVVDQLLEIEPADRPRSALEALQALREDPADRGAARALPWLGGDLPLRCLIDAARRNRSVDVIGPPGSGRSRCLEETARTLGREGIQVIRLGPAAGPLAALAPLIGPLADRTDARLEEILIDVDQRLSAALSAGSVLLVDDAAALDRLSAQAIERARTWGTVIRARLPVPPGTPAGAAIDTVHLAPLDEDALLPLFTGRERLFHLRTCAARVLWARTGGLPARIQAELDAWERSGLARWTGEALALDRDALDRLEAGLASSLGMARGAETDAIVARLPERQQDLLRWIELCYPDARAEDLAQAAEEPRWRVEAEVDELLPLGAVARLADGRLWPGRPPPSPWTAEQRRAAHRAFAGVLPPGAERRLLHLVRAYEGSAGDALIIAQEAATLAARQAREGKLGHAIEALAEGLHVLRRHAGAELRQGERADTVLASLLASWVEIALIEGTPRALDRVLYEICREPTHRGGSCTAALAALEALVRAALALAAGSDRALAMAEAVPSFDDPRLERGHQHLCIMAARRMSPERLSRALASAEAWALRVGDDLAHAALWGWMGRMHYQQGRFEESAALHAAAAELSPWAIARAEAMFQVASAWMESFRFDESTAQAERARRLAASCRDTLCEAKAEWLLRAVAYRRGDALEPDPELVDAVAAVGVPDLEALVCVTEAAVLFRRGDREGTARLAERAYRLWSPMGKRWPALVCRALALAAAPASPVDEAHALAERARDCPVPGMGIQVLGLLALAYPEARAKWAGLAPPLVADVPVSVRRFRMDVLSVDECLDALA